MGPDLEEGVTPNPDDLDSDPGNAHSSGAEDGDAEDDPAVMAAMLASFNKVKGDSPATEAASKTTTTKDDDTGTPPAEEDLTATLFNEDGEEDGDADASANAGTETTPPVVEEDPDIPGLGKASTIKAQLAQLENLQRQMATQAGSMGHLRQLVTTAGQGKPITAESLKRVSDEFGPEFAKSLADDLNDAGFGRGGAVDAGTIQQVVAEQVEQAREGMRREFEKKTVLRDHPDADDHFALPKLDAQGNPVFTVAKDANGNDIQVPVSVPGPKHEAFMKFIATLPQERKAELQTNGWDSRVVGRALSDFKAHTNKVATSQTTQQQRLARGAVPSTGTGKQATQPSVDPVMQGWSNVRGKSRGNAAQHRGAARK